MDCAWNQSARVVLFLLRDACCCSLALGGGSVAIPIKIKRVPTSSFDEQTGPEPLHWYARPATISNARRRARIFFPELSAFHVILARSNTLCRHMRKGSGSSPTNKVDSIQASKTGQQPRRSKVKTYFPYQNITRAHRVHRIKHSA